MAPLFIVSLVRFRADSRSDLKVIDLLDLPSPEAPGEAPN